jgi:hypothetical protein
MLICTGMIILTRLNSEKAMRQFAIIAVSAVVTWIIPFIIDRVWQLVRIPWVYGILGLVLLLVVCVIGNTSYGAQLSLTVKGISVQPSEFVKISFVFFVAAMLYRSTQFKHVAVTTIMAAAHVLVLVLSRDLGSALIYFVTYLMMLRDKQLLSVPFNEELDSKNVDLASIITALKEYDNYKNCIYNYYVVENGVAKRITEGTDQEVQEKYTKEKLYHWEAFWNLVKMCVEDWSPSA